jgi:hypothetical protein
VHNSGINALTGVEREDDILVIDVPAGLGLTAKVSEIENNIHLAVVIEQAIFQLFGAARSGVENLTPAATYAQAYQAPPGPGATFQTRNRFYAWTGLDRNCSLPEPQDYPRYFQHAIFYEDRPAKIPRWGSHRVILRGPSSFVYVLQLQRSFVQLKPYLEVTRVLGAEEVEQFLKRMAFTNTINGGVRGSLIGERLRPACTEFWMATSFGITEGADALLVKNLRRLMPICQFHWGQLPREELARMSALPFTLEQLARAKDSVMGPRISEEATYLFEQVNRGYQAGLCGNVVLHIAEALFQLGRMGGNSSLACFTSQTFSFAWAAQGLGGGNPSAEVENYFANILADVKAVRQIGNPAFMEQMPGAMWPIQQPVWWPALSEYLINFEYEVALSFAGDNRDVSRELAGLLRGQGCRVFFDEYEQAELWGKDLYAHLTAVYRDKALFCVIFFSKSYLSRLWTTVERQAAHERVIAEQHEYLLPLRLDDSALEGPLESIASLDLRTTPLPEIAQFIVAKLRKRFSESGAEIVKAGHSAAAAPANSP